MTVRIAAALALFLALYLAAGTVGGLIRTGDPPPVDAAYRIGLLRGPIHTDIMLPLTDRTRAALGFVGPTIQDPRARWVVIGWGARDFYTTTGDYSDLRPGPVWRALTGDSAVLRVFLAGPVTDPGGITFIPLSTAQLDRLTAIIIAAFTDQSPLDHPGLTGDDRFYPAQRRFHLLRTCNVWVGQVLRQAGIRAGIWTPFTWSLP